jgi:hypothetical protein
MEMKGTMGHQEGGPMFRDQPTQIPRDLTQFLLNTSRHTQHLQVPSAQDLVRRSLERSRNCRMSG